LELKNGFLGGISKDLYEIVSKSLDTLP
jgi:hypothetical protein